MMGPAARGAAGNEEATLPGRIPERLALFFDGGEITSGHGLGLSYRGEGIEQAPAGMAWSDQGVTG
jgi:hypothetical protein